MSKSRVLVVDDEENVCQLVSLYLEKEGFEVQVAYDGQEALEKVREQGYALDCNERSMVSHCVAVPIWNYRKEVEAAVSISVASHTFSPERKEVLVAYLQNVSQAVSLGQTAIG